VRDEACVRLLEVWPGLGRELSDAELSAARHAIVLPAAVIEPGPVDLAHAAAGAHARGPVVGAIVVDGLLTAELQARGRGPVTLHGPGDLLVLDGQAPALLGPEPAFTAVCRSAIALLDDSLLTMQASWPAVAARVLAATGRASGCGAPRNRVAPVAPIEERLLAVLSAAAEHWGGVAGDGVATDLPLTHELLARVVGGRSATVALGLRSLRDQDIIRRGNGGWVMRRSPCAPSSPHRQTRALADALDRLDRTR
jgi:hypothetical protein